MSTNTFSDSTIRLREKLRAYQTAERNTRRENDIDSFRPGLGEISKLIHELENLTEKDVSGLASRVKRRKHANCEDMFRLSHAFLQSEENIVTFMKIPGALNIIIKELTGNDSKSQILACEVLCNLSLGDSVPCEKIALAAGSYLITNLDNSDSRLQRTSLWVITNILHTGGKGYATLVSQEIGAKLMHLLFENKGTELYNDIIIALDLLMDKDDNMLSCEQLKALVQHLQLINKLDWLQMKVLFTALCTTDTLLLQDIDIPVNVEIVVTALNEVENIVHEDNIRKVLYSVRILSNLSAQHPNSYDFIESECIKIKISLADVLNKILSWNNKCVNTEILWFLRNIVSNEQILKKPKSILEYIQISKLTNL